ncbi:hypothetical protein SmJEL517_g04808 [Synchytrium microbalum]|uniref:polynucleotide adenylyltransferase n=1 Tax=Synchytrium microbalum TaxID=1806994 RepID=A0A507BQ17_9FUNG|nr:uncharacterized protein SmJEL517_g04808 [Synchytrium microbalum]TPX31990.1 hypothetical protein SmJEL517_g04808 [Synchytrium microbalum]
MSYSNTNNNNHNRPPPEYNLSLPPPPSAPYNNYQFPPPPGYQFQPPSVPHMPQMNQPYMYPPPPVPGFHPAFQQPPPPSLNNDAFIQPPPIQNPPPHQRQMLFDHDRYHPPARQSTAQPNNIDRKRKYSDDEGGSDMASEGRSVDARQFGSGGPQSPRLSKAALRKQVMGQQKKQPKQTQQQQQKSLQSSKKLKQPPQPSRQVSEAELAKRARKRLARLQKRTSRRLKREALALEQQQQQQGATGHIGPTTHGGFLPFAPAPGLSTRSTHTQGSPPQPTVSVDDSLERPRTQRIPRTAIPRFAASEARQNIKESTQEHPTPTQTATAGHVVNVARPIDSDSDDSDYESDDDMGDAEPVVSGPNHKKPQPIDLKKPLPVDLKKPQPIDLDAVIVIDMGEDETSRGKSRMQESNENVTPLPEQSPEDVDFIPFDLGRDPWLIKDEAVQHVGNGHTPRAKPLIPVSRSAPPARSSHNNSVRSEDPLMPVAIPAWVPPGKVYHRHPMEALKEEIKDFTAFMSPSRAEHEMRRICIERIRECVVKVWPKAEVHAFGSYETQLYLPSSDLDLVVLCRDANPPRCLHMLADELRRSGTNKITVVAKAKVPIIKVVDELTRFSVDVSFNGTNGLASAEIVKEFVNDPEIGSALKSLVLILKQFLVQRNLNEPFMGGLGSYALITMVAAFLKLHPKVSSRAIKAEDNLGALLIEFFEFYGRFLVSSEVGVGVHVEYGAWLFNRRERGQKWTNDRNESISVVDPQDSENDIAKSAFAYRMGRLPPQRPPRAHTILGVLMNAQKSMLAQREFVEEVYSTLNGNGLVGLSTAAINLSNGNTRFDKKPPHSGADEVGKEVVYVEYDTNDEDDGEERGKAKGKGRVNVDYSAPMPTHGKKRQDEVLDYEDGDEDLVEMLRRTKRSNK